MYLTWRWKTHQGLVSFAQYKKPQMTFVFRPCVLYQITTPQWQINNLFGLKGRNMWRCSITKTQLCGCILHAHLLPEHMECREESRVRAHCHWPDGAACVLSCLTDSVILRFAGDTDGTRSHRINDIHEPQEARIDICGVLTCWWAIHFSSSSLGDRVWRHSWQFATYIKQTLSIIS